MVPRQARPKVRDTSLSSARPIKPDVASVVAAAAIDHVGEENVPADSEPTDQVERRVRA
jgi:hypothetical protein